MQRTLQSFRRRIIELKAEKLPYLWIIIGHWKNTKNVHLTSSEKVLLHCTRQKMKVLPILQKDLN